MNKPLILAYYLPQFHPFEENDKWWGKGFTEWTNVGKAKSLFRGHKQPNVPADLGYYDLRLPIIREQQAELAREAGVGGFCYWHYWFGGKGRQLMNRIIDEVLETGSPDFPFCLGWANETWKAKQWNNDGSGDVTLMEQRYEGVEDYRFHYEYASRLFKDRRYIRVDNKPFFLIYKPQQFSDIANFISLWNKWIVEDNIADGVYFVANLDNENDYKRFIELGFNAVTPGMQSRTDPSIKANCFKKKFLNARRHYWPIPVRNDYKWICDNLWNDKMDRNEDVIPFVIPRWDHTPRSGSRGRVFVNVTTELFEKQCKKAVEGVAHKKNKIIMLKSWNEWAEGNYMEPDIIFGKGFIKALMNVQKNYEDCR